MTGSILGFAAIATYLAGWFFHQRQLRLDKQTQPLALQLVAAGAIVLHGLAIAAMLFVDGGLDLSLLKIIALLALVINILVWISGLKKPLQSLNLFLFPISALSLLIALLSGTEFGWDNSSEYVASLLYLSVFGTIIAFGAYLKLLLILGPEKAGYTGLLIPFFAILLSTLFEDYQWTAVAALGFALVGIGNYIVMGRR